MGVVVPFPRTRHRPFVRKHAINAAGLSLGGGEAYLRRQLATQRETMERRGIASHVIAAEMAALEAAIRDEVATLRQWRFRPCTAVLGRGRYASTAYNEGVHALYGVASISTADI